MWDPYTFLRHLREEEEYLAEIAEPAEEIINLNNQINLCETQTHHLRGNVHTEQTHWKPVILTAWAVTSSITPYWRHRRLCGDLKAPKKTTTAARLQTRLLCVICFFQTPNGGCVGDSGLRWRSPRAKCLASVGSASHALHDIASCFAFWREGLVCGCNALEIS